MAHIWTQNEEGRWDVTPLDVETCLRLQPASLDSHEPFVAIAAVVIGPSRPPDWTIIANTDDLRINGLPVPGGVRVLRDRDRVSLADWSIYFSTETLPAIVGYPADARQVPCARCRQPLDADVRVVRCPQCGAWHHQSESLACWTYADTCAVCPQPTDLEGGYRWTPDEL